MRRVIYPCVFDPARTVSVFDADRTNQFGEMYCVADGIAPEEVDQRWKEYVRTSSRSNDFRREA